ncbi:hypothetical protein BD408DRAFT_410984 [Parasitella parasitica]|nr:hypothetical protein BD408DRAFT_410984 [Parasitella parasitica]
MNSVHDNKDWQTTMSNQQGPLQSPSISKAEDSSPKLPHSNTVFSPNDYTQNNVTHQHPQQQQQIYPSAVTAPTASETDVNANRLPGMIAHSQPNTPRPESNEAPLYRQPIPFAARNVVRGRANLFANETGPYFSSTKPFDNLYSSDKSTLLSVRVQSKMDRGFFLADNDWTCYRRNYFQVSSVFSVHGFNHYYSVNEPHVLVKADDGALYNVQRFLLGVSARVANSEKEIELIQHTPKRDKGPQYRPKPKPITPGGNLSMSSVANNQNIVTFERVQFKTATANNGKRRAAQQYYICIIELFAETDRGQLIKVGSCQSAPLVVRGRSPGHYADNHQERHHSYTANSAASSIVAGIPAPLDATSESATPPSTLSGKTEPLTPPGRQQMQQQQPQPIYYSKPQETPQPMMHHSYDHHQQQQPQNYTYYSSYPQYANAVQPPPSNVSSPMSHPPLPSPYTHHAQVSNYAVHDASHPDPYSNEVYQNNGHTTEEVKLHHHHPQFQMQQTGPIESPHSGYDWQRARYNSSSSGSSSVPSPGGHQGNEPQQTYFSHHQHQQQQEGATYSPTTPTYSPSILQQQQARKYKNGGGAPPNLMNKQQLA